jgi:hypothetical protein
VEPPPLVAKKAVREIGEHLDKESEIKERK